MNLSCLYMRFLSYINPVTFYWPNTPRCVSSMVCLYVTGNYVKIMSEMTVNQAVSILTCLVINPLNLANNLETKIPKTAGNRGCRYDSSWWQSWHYDNSVISRKILIKLNSLRSRQNGRHFCRWHCKCIFLNENFWISNKILMKYVP